MVLKIYRKCGGWEGWRYIDKVQDVHVDESSWCIAPSDQECKLVAGVYAKIQAPEKLYKQTGQRCVLNRDSRMFEYEVMFDYAEILKNFEKDDNFLSVKVISIVLDKGEREVFITQHEPHTWLLDDQGKTIERL